jgi:thiopeptide-type bacteriocin biosynthesis protein
MPVDLDNVLCVEVFADLAGRRNGATLQEMLPRPEALLASGPEGRFVHELIVPFVQPRAPKPTRLRGARLRSDLTRSFAPGTEWVYAKLYTSEYNADRVLREVVAPLKRMAMEQRVADRWFFIRYADTGNHLRIRFHGDPAKLASTLIPALSDLTKPLIRERTLWRVQLDTYEREIERYGGDEGIILAERLFSADSETVLDLLEGVAGDAGSQVRSNLAFVGIDRLLDAFGCDLPAKRRIVGALRDGTGRDVHVTKQLRRQMGDKFREERRELTRLLDGERDDEDALSPGLAVLARRSVAIAPIADELSSLAREGRLTTDLPSLVSSYIHMFVNRLMRSQHKRQEFVLYDFLDRIYDSRMARRARGA